MTASVNTTSPRQSPPPRGGDTVIQVSDLRKVYGRKVAVSSVSFQVARGEIFGILGPNGAGKTTTVETLAGLRTPDGGTLEVLGVDPHRDPAIVKRRVGVQLQESSLQGKLRVREALQLYARFYDDPADPEELIRLLGLSEKADTAYDDLSGGQKQRLSIALALIGNPEIAILDELTTGLDPQARRDTWDLIESVRDSGVTILLVTHFMDEAQRLCDRLVVIDHGTVVAEGRPVDLIDALEETRSIRLRFAEHEHERALAAIGGLADVHTIDQEDDVVVVVGSRKVLPAVVLGLAEIDVVPDDVQTVPRTLEDVFVQVTGRRYDDTTPRDDGSHGASRGAESAARRAEGARR